MGSNNYGVFGKPFSLEGAFRVLRMKSLASGDFYYDEVAESGVVSSASELKSLIALAKSLQSVDFGNGLTGLHAECDGFQFCVVPVFEQSRITKDQPPPQSQKSDPKDIF